MKVESKGLPSMAYNVMIMDDSRGEPGDHYPGVKVESEGLPSMAYNVTIMDQETTIQG